MYRTVTLLHYMLPLVSHSAVGSECDRLGLSQNIPIWTQQRGRLNGGGLLGRTLDYVGAKKRCVLLCSVQAAAILATLNSDPSVCICCALTGDTASVDEARRQGPQAFMFTLVNLGILTILN